MAKRGVAEQALEEITGALRRLIRLPVGKVWIDYDEGADVLYVSLKRPQKATDTEELADEGVLLRYRGKELVGLTILEASKQRKDRRRGGNRGKGGRRRPTPSGRRGR